ncbi:hypothetical protein ACFQ06_15020, partial [Tessaracoccus lubricantis]
KHTVEFSSFGCDPHIHHSIQSDFRLGQLDQPYSLAAGRSNPGRVQLVRLMFGFAAERLVQLYLLALGLSNHLDVDQEPQ